MSYPAHAIEGAIDSLSEFITQNTAAITAKGLTPANIKTALENATIAYDASANSGYNLLDIDLIAGALGKTTALGKQCLQIRKNLNKTKNSGGGSSSSSSSSSGGRFRELTRGRNLPAPSPRGEGPEALELLGVLEMNSRPPLYIFNRPRTWAEAAARNPNHSHE